MERRDRRSRSKPLPAASADSDGYLHVDLVGQEEANHLVKLRTSAQERRQPVRQACAVDPMAETIS